mgnify:CR=1 FL=1
MDLDQLVSVLSSDDPLKLEPDAAADAGLDLVSTVEVAALAAAVAEGSEARETLVAGTGEAPWLAQLQLESPGKASAASGSTADASETASVTTADVETASNAGDCSSDSFFTASGAEADGWSTPPVPPSPTLAGAFPPSSPAAKRARTSGAMMEAEAAAAREGSVAFVACKGAAPAQEDGSALAASPSAAFDKAELLELLLGHVSTSLTPGGDSHSHSHSPPPSPSPPPPESPEQPCGSPASQKRRAADHAAEAEEEPAKRRRGGGAVRAC